MTEKKLRTGMILLFLPFLLFGYFAGCNRENSSPVETPQRTENIFGNTTTDGASPLLSSLQILYPTQTEEREETTDLPALSPPSDSTALSPPDQDAKEPKERLYAMTLKEKIAQLFLVTPEHLTGESTSVSYGAPTLPHEVGGVVFFAKNIETRDQCTKMIENLQRAAKTPLFIAVDEEGGRVTRIANNANMGTTLFPDMAEISDEKGAYRVGNTVGREIKELGFNLDFAPVADMNSNPENQVIGSRAFSSDPRVAAPRVAAAVKGFRDSGMLCTLKHFPGHGDTTTDSHHEATTLEKTLQQLQQTEFIPFEAGIEAGADFVMLGHIALPKVTGNTLPATLSTEIVGILRKDLHFDGLIITDSLRMNAISQHYSSGEAAVLALQAGVDMLLMPENLQEAIEGVSQAVEKGTLTEARINESVLKILELKRAAGILPTEGT